MVICKFFLQGTCKFGDNCKFEHQLGTDHNYTNSSILVQNYTNKPHSTSNVDMSTLIKSVVTDMTAAEKGGQWLLSSYAPFKEKPAFPGFEDQSMEEIRYSFYEAAKNGTLDQFKQNLQVTLQQAVMKVKALQSPSPEAVNILKSIYDTPPSQGQLNSGTFGSNQTQKSVFGGAPPNQNIFKDAPQTQNIFRDAPQTQNSVFGGNSGIFGAQTTNSVFGQNQNQNKSIFGDTTSTGSSVFSNSAFQGNQASSPFTQSQNVFGQQAFGQNVQPQSQSIFGQTPQQTNIFAQNQQNSIFAPQNPIFAQQNQNSIFGQTQQNVFQNTPPANQGGPFANQGNFQQPQLPKMENKPALEHTQNIFGVQATNNTFIANNVIGNVSEPNPDFYSKREDLTEEEIKWFESDDLDIGKIPDKPPTYEMCF